MQGRGHASTGRSHALTVPACRTDGLFAECMEAGLRLPLEKDPFCALAFCAMLLAHAQGDSASRLVLATAPAAQLLAKLLQVRHGGWPWHRFLKRD